MPILHFKGKPFLKSYHHTVQFHRLVENAKKSTSKTPSLDDNLIIHGDNLKALKALLPTHAGKVKCIYIDPPYNTGNEGWAYNDNVNSPMIQKWLGQVVAKDDLSRHDKWCCMMYPRLVLLRELLRDDGVIFVSIDANEVHHLRMMMDEIFGEMSFKNIIAVRRGIKNVQSQFETIDRLTSGHEFILIYTKDAALRLPKLSHERAESMSGKWDTFWRGTDRKTMRYALFDIYPESGQWRWEKNRAQRAVESYKSFLESGAAELDEYFFDHLTATNEKLDFVRLNEEGVVQYYVPPRDYRLVSDNWMDLNIKGNVTEFDTEKAVSLLKRVFQWLLPEGKGIILDSFAGSGTTAHAVLDLNREDGGDRKFILVECEEYADTITAERVRRVSKGVPGPRDERPRNGLGGSFSYYELGDPIDIDAMLDGTDLPTFADLAKYVFYTATGEQIDLGKLESDNYFVGSSKTFEVFLVYEPDKVRLKELALNSILAEKIHERFPGKRKLVFAPACYLDDWLMSDLNISFAQLPFEIYRIAA